MRMNQKHFDALADQYGRELPIQARLIVMRRILRHVMACDLDERTTLKRAIRQLKTRLPFTANQITRAEDLLTECRRSNRSLVMSFGLAIKALSKDIETLMSFNQLCDVLCVNPVYRAEAFEADDGSLYGVTWIGGQFEDSAHHHGKSGRYASGPITRAVDTAIQDFMINNSHLLPDPFAPGGPFYGVPMYTQQPDGAMVMSTPAVTVHSGSGSRVVASKPRRAGKPVTPSGVATLFADNENVSRHEGGQT